MLPTTRNIDNTGGSTYNATTGSSTASPAGATMASNNSVPSDTKSIPAPQLSGRPLRSAAANPSHGQSGSLLSSGTTSIPSKPAPVGSAPLNPPIQTTLLATNPVVPTPPNSNTAQPPVDPTQTSTQPSYLHRGRQYFLVDDKDKTCEKLAEEFRSDPLIQEYLDRWYEVSINKTHVNEGLVIHPKVWRQTPITNKSGTKDEQIDLQKLVVLWRGSIEVLGPDESGNYAMLAKCSPNDYGSMVLLKDLLVDIYSSTGTDEYNNYVFLVEDLSAWIVTLLGPYLGIEPHEFIEHSRSGGQRSTHHTFMSSETEPRAFSLEGATFVETLGDPAFVEDLNTRLQVEGRELFHIARCKVRRQLWAKSRHAQQLLLQKSAVGLCRAHVGKNIVRPFAKVLNMREDVFGPANLGWRATQRRTEQNSYIIESKFTLLKAMGNSYVCFTDPRLNSDQCLNHAHQIDACLQTRAEKEAGRGPKGGPGLKYEQEVAAFRGILVSRGLKPLRSGSQQERIRDAFLQLHRSKCQANPQNQAEVTESVMDDLKSIMSLLYLRLWKNSFEQISAFLDSVDLTVSNDEYFAKQLQAWRDCFGDLEIFFATSRLRLKDLAMTLKAEKSPHRSFVSELQEDCTAISERLGRVSQTVASAMSVLESKEAIKETHAVTRLTELAFIFIPLSFASSFFGMDVAEWGDDNKPSVGYFVLMSVLLMIGTYWGRLAIRSPRFQDLKTRTKEDVIFNRPTDMATRESKPISSFEVIGLFFRKLPEMLCRHCVIITVTAFLVSTPLLFLPSLFKSFNIFHSLLIFQCILLFFSALPFAIINLEHYVRSPTSSFNTISRKFRFVFVVMFPYRTLAFEYGYRVWIQKGLLMVIILWGIPTTLVWMLRDESQPRYISFCVMAGITFIAANRLTVWRQYLYLAFVPSAPFFTALPSLLIWLGDIDSLSNWSIEQKIGASIGLGFASFLTYTILLITIGFLQEKKMKFTIDPFQSDFFDTTNRPDMVAYLHGSHRGRGPSPNLTPYIQIYGQPKSALNLLRELEIVWLWWNRNRHKRKRRAQVARLNASTASVHNSAPKPATT